jgi:prepilin-type N-terminal cleavage/methylation domain-containing protein
MSSRYTFPSSRKDSSGDKHMRRTDGFSLIEIAIVLGVITLIAAAVLTSGGGLFGRAGTASLLSNIKDLAAASREFKTRYSYFPGDLPNAGTYITANGGISAGCTYAPGGSVGNGIVDTGTESDCALEHLVKSGMLGKIDYDGARYVISHPGIGPGVRASLWFDAASNANAVRVSDLPCEAALEIERKLDSASVGNTPFSEGSVRARDASNAPIQTCVPGSANDPVPMLLIRY